VSYVDKEALIKVNAVDSGNGVGSLSGLMTQPVFTARSKLKAAPMEVMVVL
jgi:hypothetical protein